MRANWHRGRLAIALAVAALVFAGVVGASRTFVERAKSETTKPVKASPSRVTPNEAQWASLEVAPVTEQVFRAEHVTEGKIAIDEDTSTPIFSPYAGRVTKLL